MFERFTAEARKALFAARRSAEASGRAEIDPEHLLAGVLAVASECIGSERTAAVLARLEASTVPADRPAPAPELIPFSTSTKRCLASTSDRAEQLGHRVRSEHLLAALLVDASTDAAKALMSAGVSAQALEVSALSRPATDTDQTSLGPTLHTFVVPFREH